MANYKYAARDAAGNKVEGAIAAKTKEEAIAEIRKRGLSLLNIASSGEEKKGSSLGEFFSGKVSAKNARASETDLILFTRQLATMVGAGIPLLECMEILAEQVENKGFRAVLTETIADIRGGVDFSSALEKFSPRTFPEIYCNMIRAGEVSGQLDEILIRLAEYQEAAAALKAKIKSAMTYPIVSLVMILGIVICLLVFIIPKFKSIFESLNIDLPLPTIILLAVADFMSNEWMIWISVSVVSFIAFGAYKKTPWGRRQLDWLSLNIPVFGPLFKKVAISRFARTFSTLIQSGVPILGALEIVAATAGNKVIEGIVIEASESVRQGDNLATPLAAYPGVFPPMVTKMIAIGEKSGALEQLLSKIAEFYDQQVETTVDQLTSLIEPLMIGVMGLLVGGMVLAIFLPIFKIQESLQNM
jgi:type IV pilus assembly protein PilC